MKLIKFIAAFLVFSVTFSLFTPVTAVKPPEYFQWKTLPSDVDYDFNCITYGKGMFVAGGDDLAIKTSRDGRHWDMAKIELNESEGIGSLDVKKIMCNGSYFTALAQLVGYQYELILYSEDGLNWTESFHESDRYKSIDYGVSGGDEFIFGGLGTFIHSKDGKTWVQESLKGMDDTDNFEASICGLHYQNGEFVALKDIFNYEGSDQVYIIKSKDCEHWSEKEIKVDKIGNISNFIYSEGEYYFKSSGEIIYKSKDLVNWQPGDIKEYNAILENIHLNELSSTDGKVKVTVGNNNSFIVDDGKNPAIDINAGELKRVYSSAANKGILVTTGANGCITTTNDGITWKKQKSGVNKTLYSVLWDGRIFIAVGEGGSIVTSGDGINWRARDSHSQNGFYKILKGNGKYIAYGVYEASVSMDGVTWRKIKYNAPIEYLYEFEGICFDGMRFVYYSNNTIYTSENGETWTTMKKLNWFESRCNLVYYKNRYIFANTAVSYDLKTFEPSQSREISKSLLYLYSLSPQQDFLLAQDSKGRLYLSPEGVGWEIVSEFSSFTNSISYFKGEYYAFLGSGIAMKGKLLRKTPEESPYTIETDIKTPENTNPPLKTASVQPIIKNKTVYLSCNVIAEAIEGSAVYDKSKKHCTIVKNGRKLVVSGNSYNYSRNEQKLRLKNKTTVSNGRIFVPAEEIFKALGYTFRFQELNKRMKVYATK